MNASDLNRVLEIWADDGILMPPNRPSVVGRLASDGYFQRLFANVRLQFQFTPSQIEVAGDLAVERVSYRSKAWALADGSEGEDSGKGIHVLQHQADGLWRLSYDLWNSDHPAGATQVSGSSLDAHR